MFLRRLLASPDDFMDHIRHYFAGSIMEICYGITVLEDNDPYISIAKEAMEGIAEAGPGAFLVDLLPVLKYVPRWFPGAEFKRKAARWRACLCEMLERPYPRVKWELESGNARPSILQSMISNLPDESDPKRGEAEKMAKAVTAAAYGGGSDTIIAVVQAFFLAMAMHPDIQRKAQAEIDAVVGQDRLPNFSDQAKLPYVNAVVQETLRWHPIFPKGVPHMSTEDDEYDGYFIPKGTIVMGNVWTILHDPNAFPDPLKYEPERYLNIKDANGRLDDTIRSPGAAAFGFGRRVCPGRHLAETSLYAAVSNVLAVYNIKPPTDDEGNEVKLREEVTNGVLSYMVPFKCVIEPRSSVALALIRGV
ncbi:uncharacterized protein LACBIDRAFT_189790 [Laccaria bicolor S238N-H82]|uniref:Predicted protein n=1 Tax=Laccaria bicolor (strain S238N-H82 / ATCC MYA-4686) TaxID=486041 RepID=B0D690_LACBS|nr:uncharacterized protein LACBIDRAFT_189790 [Laccaria bicolor S238N-H82]EDR09903.1 predicted protein [Laccaria bicolor S238N-H82]|eukprot:XP_001879288.1 predicted protein [Laccaria bicolor S238N-H82]